MKSVLEFAGYFLYVGSLFLLLPIVLVLYLLLAGYKSAVLLHTLWLQVPVCFKQVAAAASHLHRHWWLPARKWHFSWHLHKAS